MRVAAAYVLVMYGVLTVASVGGAVRAGRLAPAGGFALALTGITMIFAALGVLMGVPVGPAIAALSVGALSVLAGYNSVVLRGASGLRSEAGRTVLAGALIVLLVFGS